MFFIFKGKTLIFLTVLLFASSFSACLNSTEGNANTSEYGVFLGINSDEIEVLEDYNLVVIEPSEFEKEHIELLHAKGKKVYGYINIGAIENYRPYYDRFKMIALDSYENWEDEEWIDVASVEWQDYVIDVLGKNYSDKGFDGFFLDNADVYYHYEEDEVFEGLCIILKGLKKYDVTLIINGGDVFVKRCIKDNLYYLFDGVNQETVFTRIDFDNKTYSAQKQIETEYLIEYLSLLKSKGLSVYLLEYGASSELEEKINTYCLEHDFLYYNAEGLELK